MKVVIRCRFNWFNSSDGEKREKGDGYIFERVSIVYCVKNTRVLSFFFSFFLNESLDALKTRSSVIRFEANVSNNYVRDETEFYGENLTDGKGNARF